MAETDYCEVCGVCFGDDATCCGHCDGPPAYCNVCGRLQPATFAGLIAAIPRPVGLCGGRATAAHDGFDGCLGVDISTAVRLLERPPPTLAERALAEAAALLRALHAWLYGQAPPPALRDVVAAQGAAGWMEPLAWA